MLEMIDILILIIVICWSSIAGWVFRGKKEDWEEGKYDNDVVFALVCGFIGGSVIGFGFWFYFLS